MLRYDPQIVPVHERKLRKRADRRERLHLLVFVLCCVAITVILLVTGVWE